MKISEAIAELQKIMEEHGDATLIIEERGNGGHAEHTVSRLEFHTYYVNSEELSEEYSLSNDEIKELLPEWNQDDEIGRDINIVMIYTGRMISAT